MQNVGKVEVQPVQILVWVVRLKHFNAVECTSSCGGYCVYSKLMFAKQAWLQLGRIGSRLCR